MKAATIAVADLLNDPAAVTLPAFVRRNDLACGPDNRELFLAEGADDGRTTEAKQALAICWRCPARETCLRYALRHHERGIWGGTTEKDRDRIREGAPGDVTYLVARCPQCMARFARRFGNSQIYCGSHCRVAASYQRTKGAIL